MDATTSSSSSSKPHRSRPTVVCSECKRLKLGCNRRNPCDKCIRRGTTAKCIYTPEANDKIDLVSLNNKLISLQQGFTWLAQNYGLSPEQLQALLNNGAPPDSLANTPSIPSTPLLNARAPFPIDTSVPPIISQKPSDLGDGADPPSKHYTTSLIAFSVDSGVPPTRFRYDAAGNKSAIQVREDTAETGLETSVPVFKGSCIVVPFDDFRIWMDHPEYDFLGGLWNGLNEGNRHSKTNAPRADAWKGSSQNLDALKLTMELFLNPNPPAANPEMFGVVETHPLLPMESAPAPTFNYGAPPGWPSSNPSFFSSHPPPSAPLPDGSGMPSLLFNVGPKASPPTASNPTPSKLSPLLAKSSVSSSSLSSSLVTGTITSVHTSYLPPTTRSLRSALWAEFENVLAVYPCCISLEVFKRRVDAMFSWVADVETGFTTSTASLKKKQRVGHTTMRLRKADKSNSETGRRNGSLYDDMNHRSHRRGGSTSKDEQTTSFSAPAAMSVDTVDKMMRGGGTPASNKRRRSRGQVDSSIPTGVASSHVSSSISTALSGSSDGSKRQKSDLSTAHTTSPSDSSNNPDHDFTVSAPTLALYASVAAAFALGAQAYTMRPTQESSISGSVAPPLVSIRNRDNSDGRRKSTLGGTDRGKGRERTISAGGTMTMTLETSGLASDSIECDDSGDSSAASSVPSAVKMPPPVSNSLPPLPMGAFPYPSPNPIPFPLLTGTNTDTEGPPSLGKPFDAESLYRLSQAALLAHDTLDIAPTLDYIVAHILCWLFKLRETTLTMNSSPTSSLLAPAASTSNTGLTGSTTIHPDIWKGLGKVVNIARGMGLGVDPDDDELEREEDDDDEGDGVRGEREDGGPRQWKKELRRRVWWEVCYWDAFVSDCMGTPALIDESQYTTRLPLQADDSKFKFPWTSAHPSAVRDQGESNTLMAEEDDDDAPNISNGSYFVQKCRLQSLLKAMKQRSFRDPETGELSIPAALHFESEVQHFIKQIPKRPLHGSQDAGEGFSQQRPTPIPPTASTFGATTPLAFVESPRVNNPPILLSSQNIHRRVKDDFPIPIPFAESDIIVAQACELRTMANALIIRLWAPYLKRTSSRTNPDRSASISSASAAYSMVVASQHLISRFSLIRPISYLFYGLGGLIFQAGVILAKAAISSQEEFFTEPALRGLKRAIEVMKDPAVARPSMYEPTSGTYPFAVRPTVAQSIRILESMRTAALDESRQSGFPAKPKKKHTEAKLASSVTTAGVQTAHPHSAASPRSSNVTMLSMPQHANPTGVRSRPTSVQPMSPRPSPVPSPVPDPSQRNGIFWEIGQNINSPAAPNVPDSPTTTTHHRASSITSGHSGTEVSEMSSVNALKPASAYPVVAIRPRMVARAGAASGGTTRTLNQPKLHQNANRRESGDIASWNQNANRMARRGSADPTTEHSMPSSVQQSANIADLPPIPTPPSHMSTGMSTGQLSIANASNAYRTQPEQPYYQPFNHQRNASESLTNIQAPFNPSMSAQHPPAPAHHEAPSTSNAPLAFPPSGAYSQTSLPAQNHLQVQYQHSSTYSMSYSQPGANTSQPLNDPRFTPQPPDYGSNAQQPHSIVPTNHHSNYHTAEAAVNEHPIHHSHHNPAGGSSSSVYTPLPAQNQPYQQYHQHIRHPANGAGFYGSDQVPQTQHVQGFDGAPQGWNGPTDHNITDNAANQPGEWHGYR